MSKSAVVASSSVAHDVVLRNLKGAMYNMSVQETPNSVICMTTYNDHLFVSLENQGLFLYRIEGSEMKSVAKVESGSCFDVLVSAKHLVYIMEDENRTAARVIVRGMAEMLSLKSNTVLKPLTVINILRRAPVALHSDLGFLIIGGQAWVTSWTTTKSKKIQETKLIKDVDESHVVVLDIDSSKPVTHWKAVVNSVALLRTQVYNGHVMVGVADTRTGLRVYDLARRDGAEYVCLFHVPVEEIRNFHLVGNDVAVFHKFEPNVSFWNMKEHRTILCINIQDQMKEMSEEFFEADEDDCGLVNDDGDHVTFVMSLCFHDDMLIVYGTMSGCIFGMSVARRSKVFNIPCPFGEESGRKNVLGIALLPSGKMIVGYEKHGLVLMNFDCESPPSRPPTRCQKRQT